MTIDPRCLIATDLGILKNGSGLSETYANGAGLITYRGTFVFDGVHTPARGRVIQVAYARPQYGASGTLTRLYPRLHTMSSSVDPFVNGGNGETTVEVGCRLELMRDRKDPINVQADDVPPAWWTALTADLRPAVAPTISAQSVIVYCLTALGITLASGSSVSTDQFLRRQIDLSVGYVQMLDDLLRSALLLGHMTPAGELLVQPLSFAAVNGPVLTRDSLINLQPINNRDGAEQVTVEYDAIEAALNMGNPAAPVTGPNGENAAPLGSTPRSSFEGRDWEYELTISPPASYDIVFSDPDGNQFVATYGHIATSKTITKYRTISYRDIDDKKASQDVVLSRTTETIGCRAEANPALGSSLLSNGFGFAGGLDDLVRVFTTYEYRTDRQGPKLFKEVSETYHSQIKFAGSLGIRDYVIDGFSYTPTTNPVLISRHEVVTDANEPARRTRRSTTRYSAAGKKQSGSQGSAASAERVEDVADLPAIVKAAEELVNEGTEVTITVGRQVAVQSRPSSQERQLPPADVTTDPRFVTAQYFFGSTGSGVWDTASYVLPYAPDDYVYAVNGSGPNLIDSFVARGGARQRALLFGEIQNAIAFGRANGVSAAMTPWALPSTPFATVYLDVLGVSTAFKVLGRSWEIANGMMVMVADLMLAGTAGRLTGQTPTQWTPLPVGAMALNELGAPSGSGDLLPANTITLPGGFDPGAPGSVWASLPTNGSDTYGPNRTPAAIAPPYAQTVSILARSRSAAVVTELLYSVAPITEDVLAVSRSRALVAEVVIVNVPLTTLTLTPQVPAVYAPITVLVPLTTLTLTPHAPTVSAATIPVPLTTLTLDAFVPSVYAGNAVFVPLTTLSLTPYAPTVTAAITDPDFASVVLLIQPDQESNGSTAFTDLSSVGNAITTAGDTQVSTGITIFGKPTIAYDGDADWLTAPTGTPFNFGTGDWTVDINLNPASLPGIQFGLFDTCPINGNGSRANAFVISLKSGGNIGVSHNNFVYPDSTGTVSTGSLNKIRVSLSSGTLAYRVNGTTDASVGTITNSLSTGGCVLGRLGNIGWDFFLHGNMSIRVTKGVARTDAELTTPFPTS